MILCNQCGQPVNGDTNVCLECSTSAAEALGSARTGSSLPLDLITPGGNGRHGEGLSLIADVGEDDEDAATIVGTRPVGKDGPAGTVNTGTSNGWKRATVALSVISLALVVGLIVAAVKLNQTGSSLAQEQGEKSALSSRKAALEQSVSALEEKLKTAEQELQTVRAERKTLAERWPLTAIDMRLLNGSDSVSASEFSSPIYTGSTRYIYWRATLQNNWTGVENLKGSLCTKFIRPDGLLYTDSSSTYNCTTSLDVDLDDAETFTGAGFGNPSGNSFYKGLNRVELWWGGKKIGEKAFYVSD